MSNTEDTSTDVGNTLTMSTGGVKVEKRELIRHGDLLFIPKSIPSKAFTGNLERFIQPLINGGVIAEGTATGHHHRVADASKVRMFPRSNWSYTDTPYYIDVIDPDGVELLHEEHGQPLSPDGKPVKLGYGVWEIHRAREMDPTSNIIRTVID